MFLELSKSGSKSNPDPYLQRAKLEFKKGKIYPSNYYSSNGLNLKRGDRYCI